MRAISDLRYTDARAAAIRDAATELNNRLKGLADTLAVLDKPRKMRFGQGRVRNSFKRLSPEGFVLDPVNLQMLLPDGRLWTYSRSDSKRYPTGRFYDAPADYAQFASNSTFPGGTEFVFLGAVLGKYTFGFAKTHGDGDGDEPAGLCAIYGEGRSVRYVAADDAFAAIAESARNTMAVVAG